MEKLKSYGALYAPSDTGAIFSNCRRFRYLLWRIWDKQKPMVMFIGLNPSTANEQYDHPTIKSVCRIAMHNGYGGVYMANCFPFISTDPAQLKIHGASAINDLHLINYGPKCKDVVFAWGSFPIVKELGRDIQLMHWFPNAKALHINKNGTPKHPLYCKSTTQLVPFKPIV